MRPRCFFCNDTATTEIYTLTLHGALPISYPHAYPRPLAGRIERETLTSELLAGNPLGDPAERPVEDRKSTRLNSSHANISYAVFCLKKKNQDLLAAHCTTHFTITSLPLFT